MSRIFLVAACGLTLGACSAMPSFELPSFNSAPATVSLRIESEPPGADAKISSGATCRTPCALTVPAAGDFSVDVAMNGYLPQTVAVHAMPPDDPRESEVTQEVRLDPNPVYVELEAAPPPAKKKPAAKKPKTAAKKPTASQVATPITTARAGTPATAAGLTGEAPPMSAAAPWPTPR